MNKKLLALALAALPTVALADSSNVVVYGTLNADFENVKAEGATTPALNASSRNRVASNSSNIGFKGVEDLGNGLKAIFQVESGVNVDSGAAGTWASRNSNVGLAGNFGTVFYGNWDTPYKVSTGRLDPFGDATIAGYKSMFHTAANSFASGDTTFNARMANSVQYWTPTFSGLSGRLAYSTGEIVGTGVNAGAKPENWSVAGTYENGPLFATLAYEKHDEIGAVLNVEDKNWNLGAGYAFGPATVGFGYENQKSEAPGTSVERKSWFLGASYSIGNTTLRARYNKAGEQELNGADVANTDAKQWAIGVGQALSKRTEVYALYTKITNEAAASFDFGQNPIGAAAGADPKGFGLGIKHTF